MRARLVKTVTFLAGLYFFLEFVLPEFVLKSIGVDSAHESISQGVVLVGTMAVGLGIINLFLVHGAKIAFRRKGWFNSAALLLGLIFMMFVAVKDWGETRSVEKQGTQLDMLSQFALQISSDIEADVATAMPPEKRVEILVDHTTRAVEMLDERVTPIVQDANEDDRLIQGYSDAYQESTRKLRAVLATLDTNQERLEAMSSASVSVQVTARQIFQHEYEQSTTKRLWDLLFDGFFVSLGSAMFSLLGVYIAAAAYRAFRVRSFESGLMMLAAVLVMLGQIPFGIWIYEGMPDIRQWLLEYPNSASFRAIKIGAAVAGLVMSFRMWLSLESDFSLGDDAQ